MTALSSLTPSLPSLPPSLPPLHFFHPSLSVVLLEWGRQLSSKHISRATIVLYSFPHLGCLLDVTKTCILTYTSHCRVNRSTSPRIASSPSTTCSTTSPVACPCPCSFRTACARCSPPSEGTLCGTSRTYRTEGSTCAEASRTSRRSSTAARRGNHGNTVGVSCYSHPSL